MRIACFSVPLLLIGCAGGPSAPDWQLQSHAGMRDFSQHYLEGNSRLAEQSFQQARQALASTGRADLVARAELVRCALGTAALDVDACAAFELLKDDASPEERVYGDFVTGRLHAEDAARLPAAYRKLATAQNQAARDKALHQIADPVSRLVGAGVLFRRAQLSQEGLNAAVDTSSAQGYRRPLLAYLNVQARQAESQGDTASLEAIRRRIDLVYQSLSRPQ